MTANQNIKELIDKGGTAAYLLYLQQNQQMDLKSQIQAGKGIF